METLKYKVIKTKTQYNAYCRALEELLEKNSKSRAAQEEIDLLTLLIETWDEAHNSFYELNPIELLKSLMKDHKLKSVDLARILNVSEGLVSDMLNYKKGLSKETIRMLAEYFNLNQEAFNRSYELRVMENMHFRNAKVMNTKKELVAA